MTFVKRIPMSICEKIPIEKADEFKNWLHICTLMYLTYTTLKSLQCSDMSDFTVTAMYDNQFSPEFWYVPTNSGEKKTLLYVLNFGTVAANQLW